MEVLLIIVLLLMDMFHQVDGLITIFLISTVLPLQIISFLIINSRALATAIFPTTASAQDHGVIIPWWHLKVPTYGMMCLEKAITKV